MKLDKTQKIMIFLSVIAVIVFSTASIAGLRVGSNLSEVQSDVIYTKPNQTGIDNFLNSVNIETQTSPKFGIAVDAVLFDSDQKQYPSSTFLNLPLQTLFDPEGHLLDLGSVQFSISGVSNTNQKVVVSGKMKVLLDDKVKAERTFTGSGFTTDKTLLLSIEGQKAYTFTFADEGAEWADESVHYFKVIITSVDATIGEGFDTKSYKYNGEFLGYVLQMKLDGDKKVVIDANNTAISIFKSDNTIQTCGQNYGSYKVYLFGSYVTKQYPPLIPPTVTIYNNGFLLATSKPPVFGTRDADYGAYGCSDKISGIPRDSDIIFRVENKDYKVHTPLTQYDYKSECHYKFGISGLEGSICTSNFGWSKTG